MPVARLYQGVVAIQSGEGGAVVGGGSGEGVKHLGIAVHRRIAHRGERRRGRPPTSPSARRITSGWISSVSETRTISGFSIFLPRNSGVRPTIRPATKTAMIP